jgi:hypothetical protein
MGLSSITDFISDTIEDVVDIGTGALTGWVSSGFNPMGAVAGGSLAAISKFTGDDETPSYQSALDEVRSSSTFSPTSSRDMISELSEKYPSAGSGVSLNAQGLPTYSGRTQEIFKEPEEKETGLAQVRRVV